MSLDLNKIAEIILKYHPNCQAIYLFGSYASGLQKENSDIDLAILLAPNEAKKIANFVMSDLQNELEKTLNKDVDLLNLRNVSTVFQFQIISKGKLIFCSNNFAKDEFEMLTISFYQKLNEERKEIIKNLLK
jgi:predicted nucleotidyltransferase